MLDFTHGRWFIVHIPYMSQAREVIKINQTLKLYIEGEKVRTVCT